MIKRMSIKEYYTAPSDEVFEDIKQASIQMWKTFDDTYGYATGKIDRIKDIKNVEDNYAYMVAMFDIHNQVKLLDFVKMENTKTLILILMRGAMDEPIEKPKI